MRRTNAPDRPSFSGTVYSQRRGDTFAEGVVVRCLAAVHRAKSAKWSGEIRELLVPRLYISWLSCRWSEIYGPQRSNEVWSFSPALLKVAQVALSSVPNRE